MTDPVHAYLAAMMTKVESRMPNVKQSLEDEFYKKCKAHDLTFEYSDDGNVWRHGCKSLDEIAAFAKGLPREDAVRIWNKVVDEKILDSHRAQFYWKA